MIYLLVVSLGFHLGSFHFILHLSVVWSYCSAVLSCFSICLCRKFHNGKFEFDLSLIYSFFFFSTIVILKPGEFSIYPWLLQIFHLSSILFPTKTDQNEYRYTFFGLIGPLSDCGLQILQLLQSSGWTSWELLPKHCLCLKIPVSLQQIFDSRSSLNEFYIDLIGLTDVSSAGCFFHGLSKSFLTYFSKTWSWKSSTWLRYLWCCFIAFLIYPLVSFIPTAFLFPLMFLL